MQQEKQKLRSVEDPQAYEAAIVVAGYGDFLQQTVGSLLPEGDVQSKKVQKLLGTTLPEVFARKLRARGVAPKRLWPLLINSPAYVSLHETLFRAFFNCNRETMLEGIKEKCRVWMLPHLAEAKEKEQKRKEEEEEWKQKQLASRKERMEDVLSLEQLGESAQPPGFPGGETALAAYIGQNIRYPQSALENEIQGTVLLRFVVLEDGRIGDVVITRGLDPACDKEAVRVVKTLPNFNPGQLDGEPVKVWYTLPVRFLIQ